MILAVVKARSSRFSNYNPKTGANIDGPFAFRNLVIFNIGLASLYKLGFTFSQIFKSSYGLLLTTIQHITHSEFH